MAKETVDTQKIMDNGYDCGISAIEIGLGQLSQDSEVMLEVFEHEDIERLWELWDNSFNKAIKDYCDGKYVFEDGGLIKKTTKVEIVDEKSLDLQKISKIAVRCILEMKTRLEGEGDCAWRKSDINDFAKNAIHAIKQKGFDVDACWKD